MNIFCLEQNYLAHKREEGNEVSGEPLIFVKPPSALLQTVIPFSYPKRVNELYGGCELVLRISKSGKEIKEKLAGNYYDSITVGINFITLHIPDEFEGEELSWEKAKGWDNSSVAGTWMGVTNFKDKKDINFCLYKNRELMQLGNSGSMLYGFDSIISRVSDLFALNNGDLIFTGAPPGIGKLETGDKLEGFIEDDSVLEFDIE
jgi:2-keto-4-pentenoate hydratase/2-oxohepta-3-ene-1,7-dioic acid hydratase in catechol pathway